MENVLVFQSFLPVFIRMSGFFVTLPVPGYRGVPNMVKAALSLVVSYLIFLGGAYGPAELPASTPAYIMMLAGEALIGIGVGFLVLLIFTAFIMAGQFMDVQIGLAMAGVFDPQFGGSATLMAQFFYRLALVLYFTLNGHHHLLAALAGSYRLIPVGGAALSEASLLTVTGLFAGAFGLAFRIAAPVIIVIIIVDIALGLVSKTVPQLQVFIIGLPLKVALGLLVIYMILPHLAPLLEDVFREIPAQLYMFMESLT
jgi:flagellar biosynthetic protein FliR